MLKFARHASVVKGKNNKEISVFVPEGREQSRQPQQWFGLRTGSQVLGRWTQSSLLNQAPAGFFSYNQPSKSVGRTKPKTLRGKIFIHLTTLAGSGKPYESGWRTAENEIQWTVSLTFVGYSCMELMHELNLDIALPCGTSWKWTQKKNKATRISKRKSETYSLTSRTESRITPK